VTKSEQPVGSYEAQQNLVEAIQSSKWRVGTQLGVTIYARMGTDKASDLLIGFMDSLAGRELAEYICELHNASLI
jgi:hypothetical protein